ncbi:MAG: hypothetical protein WC539_07065 [Nitrospirota bacterium]
MADTQITFPVRAYKKPFDALKVFFFDSATAIAYSGITVCAHEMIYEVFKAYRHNDDLESVAKSINKLRDRLNGPDFLIVRTSGSPKIIKIADSGVSKITSGIAWIGDSEAANFVATNFKKGTIFDIERLFSQVIEGDEYKTVGGYPVLARGTPEGFSFVPYMKLISPRYVPKNGMQAVDFGTNQAGGYGYTTITPTAFGQNGFGLFFFQGKFGYFFHVDLRDNIAERLKAYANTPEEFIEIITNDTHIRLEHCGKLG